MVHQLYRILFVIPLALAACTTTTVVEDKMPLPVVPEYVKIPHPAGFDLADLRAIFISPLAPKDIMTTFGDTCDEEFAKLAAATDQSEERKAGANELVTNDPERMHWCFYQKISKLQEILQSDSTWTERQKKVLQSFDFLSPVANSFMTIYHDSRYLRWATQYYSKVSEWVFFKKLAPTPENTLLLTTGAKELEPWIPIQRDESKVNSVFLRYGISMMPTVASGVNPFDSNKATTEVVPPTAEEIRANALKVIAKAKAAADEVAPKKRVPASVNADGMPTSDPAKPSR